MISLDQETPGEIAEALVGRVRMRRKELGLSQEALARKSGVSFGSIKRFETSGNISFGSLIKIAIALGCEDDFDALFRRRRYASIKEVINERRT